jgi:hypothetical protein
VFIVTEKLLITVEGRDTPYANTGNHRLDIKEPINATVYVEV